MRSTVYDAHFGFTESPFGLTPDPQFFYFNAAYREAFKSLADGLEARKGVIVVTGESGTGKTTLLRKLMSGLEPKFRTAYLFNPLVSFTDLLRLILTDLALEDSLQNKSEMIGRLNEYLLEQHKDGHIVALLIDEAQDLSAEMLEELGLLTNLENDKEKLLQIALIGQPELERKLDDSGLRELNQRVALRCRLSPLAANEVGLYIESRLQAVAQCTHSFFDREAVERIARYSNGIPRLINIICDNVLLMAYAASKLKIDGEMIDEVADDLLLEQSRGATGFVPEIIKRQPAESDFAESAQDENAEYLTTVNLNHKSGDDVVVPVAVSVNEFRNRRNVRWLQLSSLLMVILIGLGGLLYLQKTGPSTHDSGEIDVPGTQMDSEFPKLAEAPAEEESDPIRPEIPHPMPYVEQPSSSDRKLPSQEIAISRATVSDEKKFDHSPPPSDDQGNDSIGNFHITGTTFVRNKPSSDAEIIATLEPGTRVNVWSRNGDYHRIRSLGRTPIRGYVHREDAFFERSK
jgi:type II secretory pathway predicted ATPase ExeA